MLRFEIKDIGPAGLRVVRALDSAWVRGMLERAEVAIADGTAAAAVDMAVTRAGATVLGQGTIDGHYHTVCSRCLGPAQIVLGGEPLAVTFLPCGEGRDQGEREIALHAAELDTYFYDGEVIELEHVLRDQLVLALPIAPLCGQGCRGLCGGCGADLNQEDCRCVDKADAASPWKMALAKLP